jgi:hypothetical protein
VATTGHVLLTSLDGLFRHVILSITGVFAARDLKTNRKRERSQTGMKTEPDQYREGTSNRVKREKKGI